MDFVIEKGSACPRSGLKLGPRTVADPGFQKGGGTLMSNFQDNSFWAEFYIKSATAKGRHEARQPT